MAHIRYTGTVARNRCKITGRRNPNFELDESRHEIKEDGEFIVASTSPRPIGMDPNRT